MPDYNLVKWPNTGEEPDGLYKPQVDINNMLWSPVVELYILWSEHQQSGIYKWYQRGVAVASMHQGRVRYTGTPNEHGSSARIDYWYVLSDIPPRVRPRHQLRYQPPIAVSATPVYFGDGEGFTLVAYDQGRERRALGPGHPTSALPACWEPDLPIQIQSRAVDPLDYDIDEVSVYVNSCDPI